ncbi:bone morphogenetic protein 1-like [Physella acuta]|uniref:bone morphogenetic protein 1-like n=1 Tax=Physella acuta TaxID=109671 RepID=UPI0027DDCC15|nr:bone morphogenetic protein 1-like [Physella acuta]
MLSTGSFILLLLTEVVSGAVLVTSEQTSDATIVELTDGASTGQSGAGHNNNNNTNNDNVRNEQEIALPPLDTNSQQKPFIMDEITSTTETKLKKRMVIKDPKHIWPNKTIPFKIFKTHFTRTQRKEIKKAIKEWRNYTCIKIKKAKESDVNYVKIKKGNDCSAVVGMKGGPQSIVLTDNCSSKDLILHEIGHTIGFYHEHNRPDRDDYVEIILPNVDKKLKKNFEKQLPENVTITGPHWAIEVEFMILDLGI